MIITKITPLKIGAVTIKNNLLMAPMAGITDLPFRRLAREAGVGLAYTEMVSAQALVYHDQKTYEIMKPAGDEHPVAVQIFGSKPVVMAEAARIVQDAGADIIDINLGCPVAKIAKAGAGAKLSENEVQARAVMEAVVKSVSVPVTIKIRIGFRKGENRAPLFVKIAQETGIQMVAIHGRYAPDGHDGQPDLDAVRQAVEGATIPIIANGGVHDELSAAEVFEKTCCHGLMLGRAPIGDPSLFDRIIRFFNTGIKEQGPTWEDRIHLLKKHALMAAEHYGEELGIVRLRKIAPYCLKGMPNASMIRNRFNQLTRCAQLDELMEEIWSSPYFGEEN
jgi:tRNA-dihydrouridine synthase B